MIRTGMTAAVITVAVLAGCQSDTRTGSAPAAHSAGEARKTELQTAIAARYENPEAHYQLGKIYHQEGRMERAEFHYNVAMGFDPTHRRAQAAMVRLFKDRQDPQRARNAAELYIGQAANSADALMALGRGFQHEGLYDYALQCYQNAQTLAPNSAPVHKQLGYFYLNRGDRARAETHLRRSFEINPDQPDVAAELGRMGVRVQVPPRKTTGILGPIQDVFRGEQADETLR